MDSNLQDSQNPDINQTPQQNPSIPFASLTLSIPKTLPSFFIQTPQIPPSSLKLPQTIKTPCQILNNSLISSIPISQNFIKSSFSSFPLQKTLLFDPKTIKIPSSLNLSLNLPIPISQKVIKSNLSSYPLQNTLSLSPTRPTEPSRAAGLRRVSVVWFRNDLRVQDNESLVTANNESLTVLPVFCFDDKDFKGKWGFGFDKMGANQANFLIESVCDLRNSLRAKGSDLIVRIGKPETVLAELVKAVGAESVYVQREVANDEVKNEGKIENVLKDEGVEVKYFWGSTLYHVDDLPFKLEDMPTNYAGFREKVKGLKVRNAFEVADQLKGLPSGGNVEAGEIPTLADLGINSPAASMSQGQPVSDASMVGGETEALNRVKKFAAECRANPPKETNDGSNDTVYGANFSCKMSPWLTVGCVSPRTMFDELQKSTSRTISASSNGKDGDSGMNWLMYELLWRDFFRFVTRKYSASKQCNIASVTV